jgi:FkbM family methyltransferase
MYKIINVIKSQLKKYLPNKLYFLFYSLFKYARYLLSNQTAREKDELTLIHFTKPLYKKVVLDDISFEIKLDPHNGLVDKEIYAKGVWEAEMLREIRTHLTKDSVCLDIGSNIGQHALYISKVATNGKVYAFDPIKKLTDQITESINKNNITNIEVCNFGLSDKEEVKDIYLNNLNMGNTTFKKRLGASDVIKAETKVFDTFWNNRSKIDFVKIDVEGYEYYCLLGMKESIKAYHPKMVIEFSPIFYNKMDISNEEFLNYIFDLGYKIYDLDDNKKEITKETIPAFLEHTPSQTNILCI